MCCRCWVAAKYDNVSGVYCNVASPGRGLGKSKNEMWQVSGGTWGTGGSTWWEGSGETQSVKLKRFPFDQKFRIEIPECL